jgi:hypothetical protein
MSDFSIISSASSSIARYLSFCFSQKPPIDNKATNVLLVRTEDLELANSNESLITSPCLTLCLYRIDFNKVMRAAWSSAAHVDGEAHLPLDLHFLLTAWASNAENEYKILGRAMQCIENTPILSGPLLDPIADDWSPQDSIQFCMEELTNEEIMRIFDSLPVDYKLSIPYVARVVVLDGGENYLDTEVTSVVNQLSAKVGG